MALRFHRPKGGAMGALVGVTISLAELQQLCREAAPGKRPHTCGTASVLDGSARRVSLAPPPPTSLHLHSPHEAGGQLPQKSTVPKVPKEIFLRLQGSCSG